VSCDLYHGYRTLTSQWYQHSHNKPMALKAIARMIQTMLYAKRFFPYYVHNILGGIEEDGEDSRLCIFYCVY
jgi:20S proteasome alpha/beta subunit